MNSRSTIVAVVLAAIGVFGVIVLYRDGSTGTGDVLLVLPGASKIPVDAVNGITVDRAGEASMRFERNGNSWAQVEPLDFPMVTYSIRQLILAATQLEVVRVFEPGDVESVDLGFDPPRASVTWTWPQGSFSLSFGRRTVAGRSYVKRNDSDTVYVVTGELYGRAVEFDSKTWRDRTIFAPAPAEIDAIEIDDGSRRIVIVRQRKRWVMTEPVRTRVDPTARQALEYAVRRAKSAGFILDEPDDLSLFGLASPVGTVTIRSARQVTHGERVLTVEHVDRLLVGARTGVASEDRFGIVEGRSVVVQLPAAVVAAFFPKAVSLVDPTASGVLPADVKSIVIRRGDGELRLQRDMERWTAPDLGAVADAATVEAFLDMLATARAIRIEIVDRPMFSAAGRSITLFGFDGRPLDTVRFGLTLPGETAALDQLDQLIMDNGDNVWRIFPDGTELPVSPEDFGIEVTAGAPGAQ